MKNAVEWVRSNLATAVGLTLVGGLAVAVFAACATIMHGSTQDIAVSSQPSGATVMVDNERLGETPVTAEMDRGSEHTIELELEGYEPYEIQVTKNVSGWVAGNIVFGGLIGLAVDAATGGLYKLSPKEVNAELSEADMAVSTDEGDLFVTVTLAPEDDWEKIGHLDDS